jgi:hypothetical protein
MAPEPVVKLITKKMNQLNGVASKNWPILPDNKTTGSIIKVVNPYRRYVARGKLSAPNAFLLNTVLLPKANAASKEYREAKI